MIFLERSNMNPPMRAGINTFNVVCVIVTLNIVLSSSLAMMVRRNTITVSRIPIPEMLIGIVKAITAAKHKVAQIIIILVNSDLNARNSIFP